MTTQLKKAEEFNDGPDVTAPLKTGSLVLVPRFTTSAGNFFSRRSGHYVLSPENSDKKATRKKEKRNGRPYCAARDSFVVQSSTPTEVYFTVRSPIVG